MKFSQQLRQEADYLFEATYNHPFVQGIGSGDLTKEQLIHYIKQDYEFLNAMVRCRALGMAKCTTREEMEMFNTSIHFILDDELQPHENFCDVAGVKYEDLQGYPLAPIAQHYTTYMLHVSQNGTLGEMISATLPCPWVYLYVGEKLMEDFKPEKDHPFYDWITFYGDQPEPRMYVYLDKLDEIAKTASEEEKERIKNHFMISSELEYMFFDMSYHVHDWPIQKETTKA